MREGFDNDKYIELQAERIRERVDQFGGKLYLEFGGKLFDDYHASRVLPGFKPDTKISMLQSMKDDVEIVIAINANDIERSKVRGDLGITYDEDVLRLMDIFRSMGFKVGSVVITRYANQPDADLFRKRLTAMGITSYLHYPIPGYPNDIDYIVSDEGFGKNEYIETERPIVVVTAPGPGSGKMATCLSQLYHEHKRGITAGYAKYETFPIWNLPLSHPVNIAYEAATADLDDDNIIDPFHLEAYGETTVNYNRDVEIFPVLRATMERISGAVSLPVAHGHGREHGGAGHFRRRGVPRGGQQRDRAPLLPDRRGDQAHGRGRGGPEEDRAAHEPGEHHPEPLAGPLGGAAEGGNDGRPRRCHGAAGRARGHGQDGQPARCGLGAAHERAQGRLGGRRRALCHLRRRAGAHLPPEDRRT